MQSIQDLNYMVKQGSISREEAQRCIAAVMSELSDCHQELHANGMTKQASLGNSILTALATSAALTAGGLGVNYAVTKYDESRMRGQQRKAYDDMLRLDPDIQQIPRDKIQEYAGIFKTVAPTLATNPHLMGNFVKRQAASFGGVGFEEAGQLARADQAISGNKGPSIGKQLADNLIHQGVGTLGQNVNMIARNRIERQMQDPVAQGQLAAQQQVAAQQYYKDKGLLPSGKSMEDTAAEAVAKGVSKNFVAKMPPEYAATHLPKKMREPYLEAVKADSQEKKASYSMMGSPFEQSNLGMLDAMMGG